MLFNVHVTVVRAIRELQRYTDPGALDDRGDGWSDAVSYTFGINAERQQRLRGWRIVPRNTRSTGTASTLAAWSQCSR